MNRRVAATAAACAVGIAFFLAGYPRVGLALVFAGASMGFMLAMDADGGERTTLLMLGTAAFALLLAGVLLLVFGFWLGAQQH